MSVYGSTGMETEYKTHLNTELAHDLGGEHNFVHAVALVGVDAASKTVHLRGSCDRRSSGDMFNETN